MSHKQLCNSRLSEDVILIKENLGIMGLRLRIKNQKVKIILEKEKFINKFKSMVISDKKSKNGTIEGN